MALNALFQMFRPKFARNRASFSGSLAYIDRLPTSRPLSLTHGLLGRPREAFVFANAAYNYASARSQRLALRPAISTNSNSYSVSPNISDFRHLGDGRTWHPMGASRPLLTMHKGADRLVAQPVKKAVTMPPFDPSRMDDREYRGFARGFYSKEYWALVNARVRDNSRLRFSWPERLVICLKRQIRREVMNAFGFAGQTGFRVPVWSPNSRIEC